MEPEQQCVSSACTKILCWSCKDSSFVWSSKVLLDEPTDEQEHNLQAFLAGRVVFVWFTTGSGKSLWYIALLSAFGYKWFKSKGNLQGQILSSCIVVVVFPLTALTVDQVAMLKNRGLKAAFVGRKTNWWKHSTASWKRSFYICVYESWITTESTLLEGDI